MASKRISQASSAPSSRASYYTDHGPNGTSSDNISYRLRDDSFSSSLKELRKHDHLDKGGPVELKKSVGLISGTALIVGTMIGSGIFISPRGVALGSGSVGLTLFVWTISGIIAMCGALSYAELGTMISKSGAEYSYLLTGFGPLQKVVGPLPAFLFAWVNVLLLRPAMVAIIMLAFATYCIEPFFTECATVMAPIKCLAALGIVVLTLINCFDVRIATGLQNVLAVAKIVALVIIIIGGFVMMGQGNTQHLSTGFGGTKREAGPIAIAFYNGMWAYDGWNNLNYVTEEIINPYVNLPRSIYIGIPLVTVLYVLVNISYFSVLSVEELLASPAVAVTWGNRVLGVMAWIIPVAVALSTLGAANGTIFSTGRLNYVAGREGHMLEILSMVHIKKFTPSPSIIFTSILALIMIIPGNIDSLIDFFSFAVWMFYGATMVVLIVMRFTMRETPRPYKVPIFIPVIVLVASIYFIFAPIIDDPRVEFLYAVIFIVAGLIFYFPFVYFKKELPGMDRITTFFQLLLEVLPPDNPAEPPTSTC